MARAHRAGSARTRTRPRRDPRRSRLLAARDARSRRRRGGARAHGRGSRRAREPRRIGRRRAGPRGPRPARRRLNPGDGSAMKASAGIRYESARARQGHVESWFLKANDPQSRRAVWLKWTVWAGDRAPTAAIAEAWAVAFSAKSGHVAAKMAVPFGEASDALRPRRPRASRSTGARSRASGLAGEWRPASERSPTISASSRWPSRWLHFPERAGCTRGRWPVAEARVARPERARLRASRGRRGRWDVDGWPGMVGHNWGRRHSPLYAWGQCNAWDDGDDLVLEGARSAAADPCWEATILCLRHEGVRHDLNGFRSIARNGGAITPRRWRFRVIGARRRSRARCGPTPTTSSVSSTRTPTARAVTASTRSSPGPRSR